MITVRYFAAAAEAAELSTEQVVAATVGELFERIRSGRDDHFAAVLKRCSVLVSGRRTTDPTTPLTDGDTVDVLPPFAGG